MNKIKPATEIFRWSFRKKGKNVINMCSHFFVFSGSLIALMYGASPTALANPSGGVVVGGSASIVSTPQELQIHQASDRTLIEWNNFDIDAGETTRFLQPSQTAIALNRVVNSDQITKINGNLLANGRVIVINPNGVLIGAQGNVDVASFIATTADLDDADFMSGAPILTFNRAGSDAGIVENNGSITVAETGLAALVAPTARNNGTINARLAKVQMAGADTFAVDFYGDGLISYSLGTKAGNKKRELTVENNGTIIADGGSVTMTAADASEVVDSVINNKGTVRAQGLVSKNGEIILTGKGASVKNSGKLDVSATKNGKAGSIKVGGDKQGKGTLAKAKTVEISKDAVLMADAGDAGNGGQIIVWSDLATLSRGTYLARGGKHSGNGGFVETSSLLNLDVDGSVVNTLAAFGNAGDWLLDPDNIIISTSGSSYVGLPASGNSIVDVNTINNAMSNVNLTATNEIRFNTSVNMQNAGVGFKAFTTFGSINLNNNSITTRKGAIELDAGTDINAGTGRIDSNGANITLKALDDITFTGTILQSDGKDILLDAQDDIFLNGVKASTNGGGFKILVYSDRNFLGDLYMDNTTINTTGGNSAGVIQVKERNDGNVTESELGTNNTYSTSSGGKGGKIDIYATDVTQTNNNNCLKAGGASTACSAVADPVTLTVTSGGSKIYGDADPAALYTVSTALTGDSAFYGAATRAAGENAGSYAISRGTLDIMGSTAYNVVYNFTTPFVIGKANLNVTANAVSKIYGDADPALTYTYSSLRNGDTASIFTGALTRNSGENVGTYEITRGTLSAGNNYNFFFTGKNLTINKANLLVKADDKTKIYGDNDPLLTATFTGLKNGDTQSMFNVSTIRATGQNVGNYAITTTLNAPAPITTFVPNTITVGGISMTVGSIPTVAIPFDVRSNYNITTEAGNFAITKRDITAQVKNFQRQYGDANPSFDWNSVTWGNLANGETGSEIDSLGFETFSSITANAGSWNDVILKTFSDNNYNLTTNNKGSMEVIKRNITADVKGYKRTYGDENPIWNWENVTWGNLANGEDGSVIDELGFETYSLVTSNAGSWNDLILKTFKDNNYNLTTNNKASIEVIKRDITADVKGYKRTYGDENPIWNWENVTWGNLALNQDGSVIDKLVFETYSNKNMDAGSWNDLILKEFEDNNYNLTINNKNSVEVVRANLNILADALTKTYGDADPVLTFTASGFKLNDTASSVVTGSQTRAPGQNVGAYAISQGSLDAGKNYTISYMGNGLTITPKSLLVKATNQTKVYGSTDPLLTYTVDGLVNGDTEDAFNFTLSRELGETVGNYEIFFNRQQQANVFAFDLLGEELPVEPAFDVTKNYAVTLQNGSFLITPKSLLIKAANQTKVYGDVDPLLTYTFDGLEFDDNADDFNISISRDSGENVGQYAINLFFNKKEQIKFISDEANPMLATQEIVFIVPKLSSVSRNYNIELENAALDITPAQLSVLAINNGKSFGTVDPVLGFIAAGFKFSDDVASILSGNVSRNAGEAIGSYDITQGTLELLSQNYNLDFTDGEFVIVAPDRTVFPTIPLTDVTRPLFSVAARAFNSNPLFIQSNLNGFNVDVNLLAGNVTPTTSFTPTALANLAPEAGDDAESVANIEPAAGDEESNQSQQQSSQNNNSDIDCANNFLSNQPCTTEGVN